MPLLTIDNSYSNISGLTPQQEKDIRNLLSYTLNPKTAYFSGGYNQKRYLIDKKGNFPTGLLSYVKEYLKDISTTVNVIRRVPKPFLEPLALNLTHTPYLDQIEAVKAVKQFPTGIISAPTGTGKSIMIAMAIAAKNVKTLVIVPNLGIKDQLLAQLKECFGSRAGGFGKDIAVENIDSKALHQKSDYRCLIIDEAHHSAAKTYRTLNKKYWNDIYYRYFYTATPFRSRDEEQLLMESITGQVIYRLTYEDAVKKGYIVPVEPYTIEMPKSSTDGYTWKEVYNDLVINNEVRNECIIELLKLLNYSGKSTLCLVKEIRHGEILSDNGRFPFANGLNEDSKNLIVKFNKEEIRTLIGTYGILGEGIDSKPAEYVIIAGLGRSKNAFMQQCGRAVRKYKIKESAKIIIVKDSSHKFTLQHYKSQVKFLQEEYGIKPAMLEFEVKIL